MNQRFFYANEGPEVGPVSASQLKKAATTGELKPDGKVRKEGSRNWHPATEIKGLFPSTPLPPHSPAPTREEMFYYAEDGPEVGPVSARQLKEAAASGNLTRDGRVRKERSTRWHPASEVRGLFPSLPTTQPVPEGESVPPTESWAPEPQADLRYLDEPAEPVERHPPVSRTVIAGALASAFLAGACGDLLRPVGRINLALFLTTLLGGLVVVLARGRVGAMGRALACLAAVLGIWTGLAAVAGRDDRGCLATLVPPLAQTQARVLAPRGNSPGPEPARESGVRREPAVELLRLEAGEEGKRLAVAFTPDGRYLLSCRYDYDFQPARATHDNNVLVWDSQAQREVRRFAGPPTRCWNPTFSHDGRHVLFVEVQLDREVVRKEPNAPPEKSVVGKKLRLWSVEKGQEVRAWDTANVGEETAAFSPDDRHVFTAGSRPKVSVWDPQAGRLERDLEVPNLRVHDLALGPAGGKLLAFGAPEETRLLETANGRELARFPRRLDDFALAADGRRLFWLSRMALLPAEKTDTRPPEGNQVAARCAAFSADGRLLVTGHASPEVKGGVGARLWEIPPDKLPGMTSIEKAGRQAWVVPLDRPVHAVALSPDGRWLITAGEEFVVLWDLPGRQEVSRLDAKGLGEIDRLIFSPDSKLALASSPQAGGMSVRLWRLPR